MQRIEALLPEAAKDAFIAKQKVDMGAKRAKARYVIHGASVASAAVAVSPIPVSDVVVMVPLQAIMVLSIGKIYGYNISLGRAKELLVVAGGGVLLRYGYQILVKLVPGLGSVIGPAIAYGGTVALGEAVLAYFESGMKATLEELRDVYKHAKDQAELDFKNRDAKSKIKNNEDELKSLRKQLEDGIMTQEEYENRDRKLLE